MCVCEGETLVDPRVLTARSGLLGSNLPDCIMMRGSNPTMGISVYDGGHSCKPLLQCLGGLSRPPIVG